MDDKCKDCPYFQCVQKDIIELKNEVQELSTRLEGLEKNDSAKGEQVKTIFNMLAEIKSNMQKIVDKIESIQFRPTDTAEKIKLIIITAIVSGMIGFIISKL